MRREIIEQVREEFGPVEYFPGSPIKTMPNGWFLLEINPCPSEDEKYMVAADICNNRRINVTDGKVYHSYNCTASDHRFPSGMEHIKEALDMVEDEIFLVAVHPGLSDVLMGQPIAIPLEPEINYIQYPDHLHLNPGHGRPTKFSKELVILPESLCYTTNPDNLDNGPAKRLLHAFDYITIWLFRHQIWLATRELYSKGTWIGPQVTTIPGGYYPYFLNPDGPCHCGKERKYRNCHFAYDLSETAKLHFKELNDPHLKKVRGLKPILSSSNRWNEFIKEPQVEVYNQLRNELL